VALALELRLLEAKAGMAPPELQDGLAAAAASLTEALSELRELARGLHPQILSTDGLRPALEQLASIPWSFTSALTLVRAQRRKGTL
jgi:signal transduction histidine kinase